MIIIVIIITMMTIVIVIKIIISMIIFVIIIILMMIRVGTASTSIIVTIIKIVIIKIRHYDDDNEYDDQGRHSEHLPGEWKSLSLSLEHIIFVMIIFDIITITMMINMMIRVGTASTSLESGSGIT